jgi:transmembrane sensor
VKLDFNVPNIETQRAFEHWLEAAPLHAVAWRRMQALKNDFATLPPLLALDALQAADQRRKVGVGALQRRQLLKLMTVAGSGVALSWGAREITPWQRLFADASTLVGEQRKLQLADGTAVMLNTDTAIGTDFNGARRLIRLRRGEILITTGGDANSANPRPFWVQTPFGTMRALGTRFAVRLEAEQARISVEQGAMQMYPSGRDNTLENTAGTVARAGESWWLSANSAAPARMLGFDPIGWADGVIAAKNMRLVDLLAELARYRRGRIVCDARIAEQRVSGIYHIRDTDRALQFLAQTQVLRITYRTRFWVEIGAALS